MKNIVLLLLLIPACLGAYDFGLLLDQTAGFSGDISGDTPAVDDTVALIPRLSIFLGETDSWEIFISAGITADYESEEWTFAPELLRTEISGRDGNFRMKIGRMSYADPLNFVVDGLFDGAQYSIDSPVGTFSLGAWYTGLLYKNKAYITMTPEDFISYYTPVDYNNFADTYFASKRLLTGLNWEHPSLAEIVRLRFAIIGQYDLNGHDALYHSQYASLKAAMLVKRFAFELGGAFQTAEAGKIDKDHFSIGYAGELGVSWALPAAFQSQLSLNGQYSSGKAESGPVAAFVPVTAKEHGNILKAQFSGLSIINLDYTMRMHETLSSGLTASYFIRNDLGTYTGYPLLGSEDSGGHFLGLEFFWRLIWSPISDLRLNLGGSIFIPSAGDAAPKADYQWRVEMGMVLALY
jgi:hypothetical protein